MLDSVRESKILSEIRAVENRLSPENLHWDGERNKKEAHKEERILTKQLQGLVKELGRQPTIKELYY